MTDVFKALSDPTRRTIVEELRHRNGQSLFSLCARLATNHWLTASRQAISQHLDVLEAAGLVTTRREGRYKVIFLEPPRPSRRSPRAGCRSPSPPVAPAPASTADPEAQPGRRTGMRVTWVSVFADDQERALRFYTDVLGFLAKHDVPVGQPGAEHADSH